MKKLSVGIILGENIPSYRAHSFNVLKMAQGFKNIGCNVEVITSENKNTVKYQEKIKDIYAHYGINKKIKITYLIPSRKAYERGKTKHDPVFCENTLSYIKKKNFDFVFCRSNYLMPYLTVREGIPTFLETHDRHKINSPEMRRFADEVAHLDAFKGIVTIHDELKLELINGGYPTKKILVLEDGVDKDRFEISNDKRLWRKKLGFNPDQLYAVYCGHLYKEKGIEVILQAAKKLQELKNLVFLLVGGNERNKQIWENYCIKHAIGNVTFIGFVPNARVPEYLKIADCLLLAYKIKNMNYKIMDIQTTSPLKLFEYMASKRPIIATNIPTISKVLQHESNALLVRPDDITEFCKGIRRVLADQILSSHLSEKAYQDANRYTWEERCKSIVQLFEKKREF
ncbi:glycosyltransferase family 4 protein [Paenibacillus sedimenti]|uniref:Glycosyltransferase family 4 protein n=1 Tax=Paenibacillus sedimenti TaxID=2770274 RepID=A0A926QKK4_9BACL|nr:glycosyltransferase family 4 protein [Paenibacillus sedimenti]MBD0381567.1 glycosyltransferase family 4 protein [Paenibacillus sedimenti]